MNRSSEHVTAYTYHCALLKDVGYALGTYVTCKTASDLEELHKRVVTRGFGLIMDDLPSLCKLYEKALARGYFEWENYPLSLRVKGSKCPEEYLLGHLIGLTFSPELGQDFDPSFEADVDVVSATRSLLNLFKKVRKDSNAKAKSKAVDEFILIDEGVATPSTFWSGKDGSKPDRRYSDYANRDQLGSIGCILQIMDKVAPFIIPDREPVWDNYRPKHGPGSVSDLKKDGDKYSFPSWPESLAQVFPSIGWASHLHGSAEESLPDYWGSEVCSKLICVPKTLSKPRTIASEPTAMQYCQQAVRRALYDMMSWNAKQVIKVTRQDVSRSLALHASASTSLATIDLSAASDRVSCDLVECAFRSNVAFLNGLRATRTTHCEVRESEIIALNKFAAMGSAVTFPVQSIIYTIAAIAVELYNMKDYDMGPVSHSLISKTLTDERGFPVIQVFGDDIICPRHHAEELALVLEALCLKVNVSKSFMTGYFREACGMDAYWGTEVTPLYLSHLGEVGEQEVVTQVEVGNNAYLKGYWNLADSIRKSIPGRFSRYIPVSSVPLPSVRHVCVQPGTLYFHRKMKYDNDSQSFLTKGFVVRSKREHTYRNDWSDLLQYFIEGSRDSIESLDYMDPPFYKGGHAGRNRISFGIRWVKAYS
jgi:hypothetical protein